MTGVAQEAPRRPGSSEPSPREHGLSAFVRCKDEEEFLLPCLLSLERFVDEIVLVFNRSTDGSRAIAEQLLPRHPQIRIFDYDPECEPIGAGYLDRVRRRPQGSLATFYNWCLERTSFSHVCKWDCDMLALPPLEAVRVAIDRHEAVAFDGYDLVGAKTTDLETRVFRFNPDRARYEDWHLYEVLSHDYPSIAKVDEKCYLHVKLGKREWIHREWRNPNDEATESVPPTGRATSRPRHLLARTTHLLRTLITRSSRGKEKGA